MITIQVNVDGSHAWIFKRIECLFRGHRFVEWTRITKDGKEPFKYQACERCRKGEPR